ncbi:hypothetical protein RHGRI_002745 [Rhododendron griersonianum]|uniref:Uncharacterized protein n=1 Tax=Rhododendron griersonianum TaxID=479676 RepID=A0AAV6LQY7_9ERIC|nr:hypothetical protein RHGRI_002745 [Rhododendron griersonianum]
MSGERKRTVKLFCPSLSKAIALVAWEEQRLDLGSISRAFGLDPATLKLNGHFIGRGVDLIASSVTWKSLLSFFSSRGLSTGETDSGALIVDGKLSRIGTKRAHEQAYVENGICCEIERPSCSINTRPRLEDEDTNFLKSKRLKERNSGDRDSEDKVARGDGFVLKRKQCLEDVVPLKRIKMAGTNSELSFSMRVTHFCRSFFRFIAGAISNTQFRCSLTSSYNMKRIREDDMVSAAPCKKTR